MCCSTFLNPSGGWAWLLYMNRNSNRYFALSHLHQYGGMASQLLSYESDMPTKIVRS